MTTAGDSSRSEDLGKQHVATILSNAPLDYMLSHDAATSSSLSASNGFANGVKTTTRAPPPWHTLYNTANTRSPSPAAVARPHCPYFAMGGVVDEGSPIKGLLVPCPHPTISPTFPQHLANLLEMPPKLPPHSPLASSALGSLTNCLTTTPEPQVSHQAIRYGPSSFQGCAGPAQRQHVLPKPICQQAPERSQAPRLHSSSPAPCKNPLGNSLKAPAVDHGTEFSAPSGRTGRAEGNVTPLKRITRFLTPTMLGPASPEPMDISPAPPACPTSATATKESAVALTGIHKASPRVQPSSSRLKALLSSGPKAAAATSPKKHVPVSDRATSGNSPGQVVSNGTLAAGTAKVGSPVVKAVEALPA